MRERGPRKESAVDELETVIQEACKPLKGKPLALSGGIDSSVLAYFVKPEVAYTVTAPGGEAFDELQYAEKVVERFGIKHRVVQTTEEGFREEVEDAIKIIGKPTPHFNIYALYKFFQTLKGDGESEIVIADGPDESMSGYARNLIFKYLYDVQKYEAFKPYEELMDSILPTDPKEHYKKITGVEGEVEGEYSGLVQYMNRVDMEFKRPEMDIMGFKFADHFGVEVHKPYETEKVDDFMFRLPVREKIAKVEYGKLALRRIANKYLPKEIAWRKVKRGGPIFPVNKAMGWEETDGEFGKDSWMRFQEEVLNEKN